MTHEEIDHTIHTHTMKKAKAHDFRSLSTLECLLERLSQMEVLMESIDIVIVLNL